MASSSRSPSDDAAIRRSIFVQGIVQGVGFRPHVHGLASRLGLGGFVRNQADGVRIEVEGPPAAVDRFEAGLGSHPPPLARIERVEAFSRAPVGQTTFCIEASDHATAKGPVVVSPDAATCGACLRELFDPADRRYRYPFINCTDCGPRLTIIRGAPYDRERTTMAGFAMCASCRAEYDDPAGRRFHAQPNACPACGPRLAVLDEAGRALSKDPLTAAAAALRRGEIVAVKGIGGYHLACDATSEAAVSALRARKHRDEKPFAVLLEGIDSAEALCEVSPAERALLLSAERPIVLLRQRRGGTVVQAVSPGNPLLGVMLPYSPLHHLLARSMDGRPLVMTSGNRSDEPIAFDDSDAALRLQGIAALFLIHDREIHLRCDDSVVRVSGGEATLLRRSRGHAPRPVALPMACRRPVLALGGHLKAVFGLGYGTSATLSPHLGDLDDHRAYREYVEAIAHYEKVFSFTPAVLAHDLHPDYASTAYARERAAEDGLPRLAVQHHHAHMASGLAEHGLTGPAIGVIFDGTGYGADGTVWGGEFLVGDCRTYERAGHLRPVALPGGEQAIREPWRVALSHLLDAGLPDRIDPLLAAQTTPAAVRTVARMIERGFNAPPCSSMGRLFDAVASLAGRRGRTTYEGQAAMELEGLASEARPDGSYPFDVETLDGRLVVDTRPLVRAVVTDCVRDLRAEVVARRFHHSVVDIIAAVCARLRAAHGLEDVVLSGGVFQNAIVSAESAARLKSEGFRVFRHREVPPNDGGLALGQLAVAAATLADQPFEGPR
jgi:hydrogenase maturation protein HypF